MTPNLLSPEELTEAGGGDLRDHIAALEADNAALLEALRCVMAHVRISSADMGGNHRYAITNDHGCSEDMGRGRTVADASHPGTTLLSEHTKALVRARNEGLEKAAQHLEHVAEGHPSNPAASALSYAALEVSAMKETET